MERTFLVDCRVIDPAESEVFENGMCVLHHGDAAPDPIGWCGDRKDPAAPDPVKEPMEGDAVLSLENGTLLPAFIDVSTVLHDLNAPLTAESTLLAYRRAATMLRNGITTVGTKCDKAGVAKSLASVGSDFTLWMPMILPVDMETSRPGFCVFRGLPKEGSEEEANWLAQARKASVLGVKAVLATCSAPVRQPNGKLTLVCMAELLVKGGFSPMEALQALTSNAAQFLHVADRTGRMCQGFEGDVLSVAGNPLEDISCLHNVTMHARGGRLTWSGVSQLKKCNFNLLPPGYEL